MGELNSQVAYKPVHKNPMDKNRSPTDTIYLYIFAIILVAWFIMNCTYLFGGNSMHPMAKDEFYHKLAYASNQAIITLPDMYRESGVGLIIWVALSGTIIFLLFLKTLNCLPKFWAVIGVIVLCLVVIILTVGIFMSTYALLTTNGPADVVNYMYSIITILIQIIFFVAGINATCKEVKFDGIADIIRKTSHAIFFFPTVFVFGLFIMIFSLTVVAFTAASLHSMNSAVAAIFSLIVGMYLIEVICNFGTVVISQCVSTWYWSENKEELSGGIILKSIGLVGRNHIGSIAFSSTVILPVVLSVYVLCTNKFPPPPNSGFKAFLVKWGLIVYASDYALTLTASHGYGIHEATKKVYSLFTRSCALVLSFCCVFAAIVGVFLAIALLISVGLAVAIFQNHTLSSDDFIKTASMYYSLGVCLFVAVFVIATVAANTVLVNTTEEIEEDEEREMNQVHGTV